ncbi:MAG TPA: FadR/GntR family transcriptional regulator [Pelomicrobium sp.]|nr:FadR/GntR family transcriptional regulator [Pelomicrobium sp.]
MPKTAKSVAAVPVGAVRKPAKLADSVYEEILGHIAGGRYAEGKRLPSEPRLAEAYGVSRPVVREALSRLRADGVVVSRHGSGSYVQRRPAPEFLRLAPIGSVADLMRCFEVRMALEGEAAALAAARRSDDDLAEMQAALDELERVIVEREVGVEADIRFHNAVARATANLLFESAMQALSVHTFHGMRVARNLSLRASAERMRRVQAEHTRVFEAIREQDPAAASKAMRAHIENARTRMLTDSVEPRRG